MRFDRSLIIAATLLGFTGAAAQGDDGTSGPCIVPNDHPNSLELFYHDDHDVEYDGRSRDAPTEFSGLTYQHFSSTGVSWLWSPTDNQRFLHRMNEYGNIGTKTEDRIDLEDVSGRDLEGATSDGTHFFVVQEDPPSIIKVAMNALDGQGAQVFELSDMKGYSTLSDPRDKTQTTLESYFDGSKANAGLEGIAIAGGGFYLVKEKNPALLIAVSGDLSEITAFSVLNCGDYKRDCSGNHPFPNHIVAPDGDVLTMDFSGLAFDTIRNGLWMISDQARAVYLYDPILETYQTFRLTTGKKDKCVIQAEGVLLYGTNILQVIQDRDTIEDTRLYEYNINVSQ